LLTAVAIFCNLHAHTIDSTHALISYPPAPNRGLYQAVTSVEIYSHVVSGKKAVLGIEFHCKIISLQN
jgi:hypothetical protein